MTANELAEELHKLFVGEEYDRLVHEIPDLLRQQAEEIETLKSEIKMQNERWKKIHPKESELEMKYSDEWWKKVAEFNKSFPFGWRR